ncbi:MAG: atsA 17, partial [Verrucomicrobiaceae bacterium]|nr:atsA 17 [Verrucomicrobiaceae bacterium]
MTFPRILSILCAAAFGLLPAVSHAAPEKPNIIFILSDDVGLGDVHCTGGPFKTPNIDAMAQ